LASRNGNGRGNLPRPGAETLEFLANPLNATIVEQLSEHPKRLSELRRRGGAAPQTTVRAHLKGMEEAGLAALQPRDGSPRILEWALTDSGKDLGAVATALDRWLRMAPEGPIELGTDDGKMAIKALAGGWSSTVLCLLAAGPMSLTELAECINDVSYPSLERRLAAMRLAGQLQVAPRDRVGTAYEATEWLQHGAAPLAAAARWEYTHAADETVPLTRSDTEAGFLLVLPLMRLALGLSGSCRLAVETEGEESSHCGAIASVEEGRVVSCSASIEDDADSWATGSPPAWAHAVVESSTERLELDGNRKLAVGLVDGLHGTLFGDGAGPTES
jgi:DNA-binding HxlR family transcriptional regulator